MAFNFTKLNKEFVNPFTFEISDKAPYVKLQDLDAEQVYTARYFYINTKSKFADHPVVGIEEQNGVWVTLPAHLTEMVKGILADNEAIEAINNGQCFFKVRSYHSDKFNRDGFSIEFVEGKETNNESK